MFNSLSGGPDYVQIFDQDDDACTRMTEFKMGSSRTTFLKDHLTTTCLSKSEDLRKSQTLMKVLPSRDYLFKRQVLVHIAGTGFSCSPVDGIPVFIKPSCEDAKNRPHIRPCVSLREDLMADAIVCKHRCQIKESRDYVLVDLAVYDTRADINVDWQVCEIWFSNE